MMSLNDMPWRRMKKEPIQSFADKSVQESRFSGVLGKIPRFQRTLSNDVDSTLRAQMPEKLELHLKPF